MTDNIASVEARSRALEETLDSKGLIPEGFRERFEATVTEHWKPENGANVVAKAWLDEAFRERLLADGTAACAELGYRGPQGEYIVVLENTENLQNVIVCTQCSCTAWPLLGFPPDWYKSIEYRARVVRESRQVLREMGLDLPVSVEIKVSDTTAETRYLVLPLRPSGTEGWNQQQLADIVTREAMIGIAQVTTS